LGTRRKADLLLLSRRFCLRFLARFVVRFLDRVANV